MFISLCTCSTQFYAVTARQRRRRHYVFGLSVDRVRSSVRSFIRLVRSCYQDISRTPWAVSMKHTWNIH